MNNTLSSNATTRQYGLDVVRIITGILLIYHGWEVFEPAKMNTYTGWFADKKYPSPAIWAYAGKTAELVAGIGFALGIFVRLSAFISIGAFAGIIFMLGGKGKIFTDDQHPFLFILLSLVFLFTSPGPLGLGNMLNGKKN
jgi:uncharacterized membrane protein YphA (DoxX/SURF4 family)